MERFSLETLLAITDGCGEALVLSGRDGQILAVNGVAGELLGWKSIGLVDQSLQELEAGGDWIPPVLRRCIESGQRQTLIQEVQGRRLALTASPVGDGLVLCVARDITEVDRLQRRLERLEKERERFTDELAGLRVTYAGREEIIAASRAMHKVLELAERVAPVDSTILLLGESGVGKGLLARAIHRWSHRFGAPFIKVDCGALPESLLESELFGYVAGAFTGANREGKVGIIEQAHRGTLFLDEVGELSPNLQVKLLHVIQERCFTRVGGVAPVRVDVRFIAATHRDLEELVVQKRFRADLFYRLNVVPITIPPLRERREDIPLLVRSFADHCCARYRVEKIFPPETVERFVANDWPGNVRELENMVERLVVTVPQKEVGPEHLPGSMGAAPRAVTGGLIGPLNEALEALELEMIAAAYHKYGSSVQVGQALGIHQTTAARKIREWKERQSI
jgi:transcriptional regulator with PAS, ATPase and Fis domain